MIYQHDEYSDEPNISSDTIANSLETESKEASGLNTEARGISIINVYILNIAQFSMNIIYINHHLHPAAKLPFFSMWVSVWYSEYSCQ